MPNALIKSVAQQSGVKKSKVEKTWKRLENEYGTNYKAIVGTLEKIYDCSSTVTDSNRTVTPFGHLKIDNCVLTAESIDDYLGSELPDGYGLDKNKIYKVYRPLTELKKAVETYNMVPLTDEHHFVDSKAVNKDKWLGGIGSEAKIVNGEIVNSLAIWDKNEVKKHLEMDADISELDFAERIRKSLTVEKPRDGLSGGYQYKLLDESGEWNGQHYDLKMVDIVCNHVALVKTPRVKVAKLADSLHNILKRKNTMDAVALIQRLSKSHPQLIADTSEEMEKEAMLDKKKKGKDKKVKDGYKESTSSSASSTDEEPDDMSDNDPEDVEDNEPEEISLKDKKKAKDKKKGKDAEPCEKPMTGDDVSALVKKHLIDYNTAKDVCERAIGKTTFAADAAPEDMYNRTLKALKVSQDGLDLSAKIALVKYIGDNKNTVIEKQKPIARDSVSDSFAIIEL